jgi:hypothetical protein
LPVTKYSGSQLNIALILKRVIVDLG